jgi:polar amino acid transport system substrate-binding protein
MEETMKRSRALIVVILSLAVALLAAACGGDEGNPGGGTTPSAETSLPAFTTVQDGVLKAASCLDYPPFESIKQGDEVGFDVDLTEEIAGRLGLSTEWTKVDFDSIFTATGLQEYDIASAAITATGKLGKERDQTVDFSDYYFNTLQSLSINSENSPDITSTDDLKPGDTVGVQKATTGEDWAKTNLKPKGIEVRSYTSATDAFRDLEGGVVDGVVNDYSSSVGIVAELPGLEVVQKIDTNEKYAFGFSPDNPGLREAFNAALKEVIDDGTYAELYHKYFEGDVPEEYAPGS